MECALALFTRKEAEDILVGQRYFKGTSQFREEFHRRFRVSDSSDSHYVEREDWEPQRYKGPIHGQEAVVLLGRGWRSIFSSS
mgnify:CR=1 FL=1